MRACRGCPVRLKTSAGACRVPMIVTQQSTEALAAPDLTAVAAKAWFWGHELVGQALRIPLGMIMGQVLVDRLIQGAFPQYDHLLQGLLLDRAYEPFTVSIEIRTPGR